MSRMNVLSGGPHLSVQDLGRKGLFASGISVGGAADPLALCEAAALLKCPIVPAIEMAGHGGRFSFDQTTDVALTGASMRATLNGRPLVWGALHRIEAGDVLVIGAAENGVYGYLTPRGGVLTERFFESRSVQASAGIGRALETGDTIPIASGTGALLKLKQPDRFSGGMVRFIEGPQTHLFSDETLARFSATTFTRDTRGNRQGIALASDGAGFSAEGQLSRVSDFITVGDIQMTGDGKPYVLLADCQTIGGYPRIGTVLPADLPKIAQARAGTVLRFERITLEEADRLSFDPAEEARALARTTSPLVRDPQDIADLLGYQLISGMIRGDEEWL